jgi:hypothetical protein
MNCIICHRPIEEHETSGETDCCITWAIGQKSVGSYYMWSQLDDRIGDLINHLTADDNPVEYFEMAWDRGSIMTDDKWVVQMEGWYPPESDKPGGSYYVRADTLPLALCRAVLTLAAVEAGDE